MAQTVTEVLNAATDSVNLINEIDAGTWDVEGMEQSEINEMVQRNIDHIEIKSSPSSSSTDWPTLVMMCMLATT